MGGAEAEQTVESRTIGCCQGVSVRYIVATNGDFISALRTITCGLASGTCDAYSFTLSSQ